jgi:hypothetical protein
MLDYYPLVIESAIAVRFQIRVLLAKYDGRGKHLIINFFFVEGQAVFPPDLHQVPIATGYSIVLDE